MSSTPVQDNVYIEKNEWYEDLKNITLIEKATEKMRFLGIIPFVWSNDPFVYFNSLIKILDLSYYHSEETRLIKFITLNWW